MSQTSPVTASVTMQDFIRTGITKFKEHELREIVAVFCRLPGIAPAGHAPSPATASILKRLCEPEAGHTIHDVVANYRAIRRDALADTSTDRLIAAPLDPETPECSICGARVFDPCRTLERARYCQLPPGTSTTYPQPSTEPSLHAAAEHVCWFDWSDNDADAVAAINVLRKVLASSVGKINEIIEECARVADAARESAKEHHGIEASIGADIAARRIRALAVTSPEGKSQ